MSDLRGLNVPFPTKDRWRLHVAIAVLAFAILLYGASGSFGRVFLAAVIAYMPGLLLFILSDNFVSRLSQDGRSGNGGKLLFYLLVVVYMAIARRLLLPLATDVLDRIASLLYAVPWLRAQYVRRRPFGRPLCSKRSTYCACD